MNAYPADLRARARELWLRGESTDEQIAEQLGVNRPGTLGDWRREERWDEMRRAVDAVAAVRVEAERSAARAKIDIRHDQIAEALEALVIRSMKSGGNARPGELRALAATAALAQRMRRTANRMDEQPVAAGANPERLRRVIFSVAKPPPGWTPRPAAKPPKPQSRPAQ